MEKKLSIIIGILFLSLFTAAAFIQADTFVVTNTDDSGAGSLRQAMEDAETHTGADTIVFHIPEGVEGYDADAGIWVIELENELPILYDDSTYIDGTTQAKFVGGDPNDKGPEIVINGSSVGEFSGIRLSSSFHTISHLVINRFSISQINIYGSHNKVIGCYLGTDFAGENRFPEQSYGIFLGMGAAFNIIGGLVEKEGNLISGSKYEGIQMRNSHYNEIRGNIIGLNRTGQDTITNGFHGIEIQSSSKHNKIGPGNVISGNNSSGINIYGTGSDSTLIMGNYIGTDASGTKRVGSQRYGISIMNKSRYNTIGGSEIEERNVISGNSYTGVEIYGDSTDGNIINGNFIGINAAGTDTLGNGSGIKLSAGTKHNQIGPGNVISGNYGSGINFRDAATDSNTVMGNIIGLDPNGTLNWGNQYNGIIIMGGASENMIGGDLAEMRNIISGNGSSGIYLYGTSTDSNRIKGNYIGTDVTGTEAVPNDNNGISLYSGAKFTVIGGDEEGEGNLISGNLVSGIGIYGEGADQNKILGNRIGTDVTGNNPLQNGDNGVKISGGSKNNRIGPDNIIAYNEWNGVVVSNEGSTGNTITENSIFSNGSLGINTVTGGNIELTPPVVTNIGSVSGTALPDALVEIFSGPDDEGKTYEDSVRADALGNFFWPKTPEGPWVTATATDGAGNTSEFSRPVLVGSIIVTTTADSGEGSLRWAIEMANQSSGLDSIHFNIATEDDGFDGTVWTIRPASRLPDIGGSTVMDGNTQTINQENTNEHGPEIVLDGRDIEGYVEGIRIFSSDNVITGLVIGGFQGSGIIISGGSARYNTIIGNYIGTTATGDDTLGNGNGIYLGQGANNTIIGGLEPENKNIISGNYGYGVMVSSDSNLIVNNYIGIDASGSRRLSNEDDGIYIYYGAQGNQIGGAGEFDSNVISGNGRYGIHISGDGTDNNRIQGNYIGLDAAGDDTVSNKRGVCISYWANHNRIGGTADKEGNIISGNEEYGIYLSLADSTEVLGNIIGTNADLDTSLGNGTYGIYAYNSSYTVMGGLTSGQGNIIACNGSNGISIPKCRYNLIRGNYIGTDSSGEKKLSNEGHGVYLADGAQYNEIGPYNMIYYNKQRGIYLTESTTIQNTITRNSIFNNKEKGIELMWDANNQIEKPVITGEKPFTGTAPPNSHIEVFSDSSDQGKIYEGQTTADGSGNWTYAGSVTGPNTTATATDSEGNTSEFSNSFTTSVKKIEDSQVPEKFFLSQNYPNPFNPETAIEFHLPFEAKVKLTVYDLQGRKIYTLVQETISAGAHVAKWNGRDQSGCSVASGIYFYRIVMNPTKGSGKREVRVRKMIFMK